MPKLFHMYDSSRTFPAFIDHCYVQVHFHIIPSPNFSAPAAAPTKPLEPLSKREMHQREFEARSGLDDEEATDLVNLIKAKL